MIDKSEFYFVAAFAFWAWAYGAFDRGLHILGVLAFVYGAYYFVRSFHEGWLEYKQNKRNKS